MSLAPGSRLGPYEVVSLVGAGGMGEVYRARDTRLDRTVAIKVLPPHSGDSPTSRQRFEREARAVSSLSHPHICALFDIGEQDGVQFLVMEYLEGETLAQRLVRGPLPIDQVLRYAIAITDALDHAHRAGIVHRDLKPANIFLCSSARRYADDSATAKLLDFGVARLRAPQRSSFPGAAQSSQAKTLTERGTIIGTVQYMAPEQLEERDADGRTDIFAFGAVVYEMVTGRQAFAGSSKASVIAAILERDPPSLSGAHSARTSEPARASEPVPPLLDQIISRCLAKNPDDRWQTARDLGQALRWVVEGRGPISTPATSPPRGWRRPRNVWLAASALLVIASLTTLAVAILSSRRAPTDARAVRLVVSPPPKQSFSESPASWALSPDGHALAFTATFGPSESERPVWIRSLDSLEARQLPDTVGAGQLFWSADSRYLAFITSGSLKKIDITGGLVQTLAEVTQQSGTWNRDGVILIRSRGEGRLSQVPATGGPARPVTTLDASRAETAHTWSQFLPGGRRFLYLARSSQPEHDSVAYVGSLDSEDPVRLFSSDSQVSYAPPGNLIYMRGNTLVARPFDARTVRLTGEPVPIAELVERNLGSRRGAFSVSQAGVLAYRPIAETELVWFDRGGRRLEKIGAPGHYRDPALSPDERHVAVARFDPATGASDIWQIELARKIASPFTFDPAPDETPLWSPDGQRILFRRSRRTPGEVWGLYEKASSGAGAEAPVTVSELPVIESGGGAVLVIATPYAWSRNGVVYSIPGTRSDLWLLPMNGDRKPVALLQTKLREWHGVPSPDGRWLAYVSDESGRTEVYVRPFASGEGKWQVSVAGGLEPTWRGDGKELFYLALDRKLVAVPIKTGATVEASAPIPLFETAMSASPNPGYTRNQYVVTADGQRFLINQTAEGAFPASIMVVVNWSEELKRLVPR